MANVSETTLSGYVNKKTRLLFQVEFVQANTMKGCMSIKLSNDLI